tara:strand:- start:24 stop:326 length:303 start_codon:yes stop_codon:yes gene_type:complete
METLLIFFFVLVSVILVILVLLQQGKGSDIGSAFGGGSSNSSFGPNSALSPLAKITSILAVIFFCLSLYITYQTREESKPVETEQTSPIFQEQNTDKIPD